jgi:hypothetical protein
VGVVLAKCLGGGGVVRDGVAAGGGRGEDGVMSDLGPEIDVYRYDRDDIIRIDVDDRGCRGVQIETKDSLVGNGIRVVPCTFPDDGRPQGWSIQKLDSSLSSSAATQPEDWVEVAYVEGKA